MNTEKFHRIYNEFRNGAMGSTHLVQELPRPFLALAAPEAQA